MRIVFSILAALALAFAGPVVAAPCNVVRGCVVRAEFCRIDPSEQANPNDQRVGTASGALLPVGPAEICHFERLLPEQGVGLCTMAMMPAAIQWIVGNEASGKPPHPGFRLKAAQCVTPDDADL
jgi:hypothetical protein